MVGNLRRSAGKMLAQYRKEYADTHAQPGTVLHFAMRLGFMPFSEQEAENILSQLVEIAEKCERGACDNRK